MVAMLEARTAAHIPASVIISGFLPEIFMLYLDFGAMVLNCFVLVANCKAATRPFPARIWSGAIRLYNRSIFNIYGAASFVSNEALYGGEMSGKSKNLLGYSKCRKICHSTRSNMLATYLLYNRASRADLSPLQRKVDRWLKLQRRYRVLLSGLRYFTVKQGLHFCVSQS